MTSEMAHHASMSVTQASIAQSRIEELEGALQVIRRMADLGIADVEKRWDALVNISSEATKVLR